MVVIRQQINPEDANDPDWYRRISGPDAADRLMRQALNFWWLKLPRDNRTVPEVSKKLRQHVEDALVKMSGPDGALHACQTGDAGHCSENMKRMAGAATDPDWFSDPANMALMRDGGADDRLLHHRMLGLAAGASKNRDRDRGSGPPHHGTSAEQSGRG
jgi:hypothetical protein